MNDQDYEGNDGHYLEFAFKFWCVFIPLVVIFLFATILAQRTYEIEEQQRLKAVEDWVADQKSRHAGYLELEEKKRRLAASPLAELTLRTELRYEDNKITGLFERRYYIANRRAVPLVSVIFGLCSGSDGSRHSTFLRHPTEEIKLIPPLTPNTERALDFTIPFSTSAISVNGEIYQAEYQDGFIEYSETITENENDRIERAQKEIVDKLNKQANEIYPWQGPSL